MKIGISSYSLRKLLKENTLRLIDVPAKVKEMGFRYIEFSTMPLSEGETAADLAKSLKEECCRVGIEVTSYTISADFITGSVGDWRAEADRIKSEVEIAAILGAKYMRHDATGGFPIGYKGPKGFDDALPYLVEGCRIVSDYALEFGIRTMVENHGFFCQDSERVEKLVNAVNRENFGILVDMGNFLCVDEDPGKAVGKLMPYVFHVHAKDFHIKSGMLPDPGVGWFKSRGGCYLKGAIIGHGDVPIVQCLDIIKRAGYTGAISIEYEGMEDPLTGIAIGLSNLKRYIG